jgi:acyl-coenzyme A synthetase/AMP-(fatty) acid ligase
MIRLQHERQCGMDGCIPGDVARRDADGYLWFEGRKKKIIIRDSVNISPQEVEGRFTTTWPSSRLP